MDLIKLFGLVRDLEAIREDNLQIHDDHDTIITQQKTLIEQNERLINTMPNISTAQYEDLIAAITSSQEALASATATIAASAKNAASVIAAATATDDISTDIANVTALGSDATALAGTISSALPAVPAPPAQTIASIHVTAASVAPGASVQLVPTALDSTGAALATQPTFTFADTTSSVGAVTASGEYTADATAPVGATDTVTATADGISGSATVTIAEASTLGPPPEQQ